MRIQLKGKDLPNYPGNYLKKYEGIAPAINFIFQSGRLSKGKKLYLAFALF